MLASPVSGDWYGVARAWWIVAALVLAFAVFAVLNAITNRKYVFVDGVIHGVVGRMGSGKSLFIVLRVLLPFCRGLSRRGGVVYSKTGRPVRRVVANFRFDPMLPNVEVRTVQPTEDESVWRKLRELAHEIGAVEGPWFDQLGVLHDGREAIPMECALCGAAAKAVGEFGLACEANADGHHMVPRFGREPILNALVVLDEMHLYNASSKLTEDRDCAWVCSMLRKLNAEMHWSSQHEMKVHKRLRDETSFFWLAGEFIGPLTWLIGDGWHSCRQYISAGQLALARDKAGTDRVPRAIDRRRYRFTRRAGKFYNSFELLRPDPSRRGAASPRVGPKRDLALVPSEDVASTG